jgi:crotonyl-CoA carboxylase/reductase
MMSQAVSDPAPAEVTLMHSTSVREAMHPGIMACTPTATLPEVAQLMATCHVHCVAVVGADPDKAPRLSGIVTDVDLVRWATSGRTHVPAGAIVAEPALAVAPQASVHEAAQLMADHGVDHLVVADARRRAPVGVISALDVARVLAEPAVEAAERRMS